MQFNKEDIYKSLKAYYEGTQCDPSDQQTKNLLDLIKRITNGVDQLYGVCYLQSYSGGVHYSHKDQCLSIALVDAFGVGKQITIHVAPVDLELNPEQSAAKDLDNRTMDKLVADQMGYTPGVGHSSPTYDAYLRLNNTLTGLQFLIRPNLHLGIRARSTLAAVWERIVGDTRTTVSLTVVD